MNSKRTVSILIIVLLVGILAACQGQPETVVVTREMTRVVTETVEGIPPISAGEAEEGSAAIGSERAADAPPPPETGAKVPPSRETSVDASEPEVKSSSDTTAEIRAEEEIALATPVPTMVSEAAAPVAALSQESYLTAGEVDDNAEWDDYLNYVNRYQGPAIIPVDVSERHQIWVRNSQERPILGALIRISTENGREVTTLRTHSDGRAYFFPRAYALQASTYTVAVEVNGLTQTFTLAAGPQTSQREWTIIHPGGDQIQPATQLDILFLIDATGSMADEINQLKENIHVIAAQIDALPSRPDVRFGLVAYRDRGDMFVTRVFDFTPDVNEFAEILAGVYAEGGGDYPEDLNEALSRAVHEPEWRVENTVSLIFLVADAPPHLDYGQQNHYAYEMSQAAARGIKIYPIASSGLDAMGEYVFRQLAQFTGGRFIFLTYGPDGPGSPGGETTMNVDDYTVSALHRLVVKIVEEELSYLGQ